jgi:membrane-bound lytic murein transglycosylase A
MRARTSARLACRLLTLVLSVHFAFLGGCARAPLSGPNDRASALRRTSAPAELVRDDLPLSALASAVRAEITYLEAHAGAGGPWTFGARTLTSAQYVAGLRQFAELAERAVALPDADRGARFADSVREAFDFYEVYGREGWGDVFVSSYYEPLLEGSAKKTARHSRPLYAVPADLVSLDPGAFDPKYRDDRKLRGRLGKSPLGTPAFLPYYTREEIDSQGALAGRKLELAWVDPWDAFLLQIQGSGTVRLAGGRTLRLIYADKNGGRYDSIGKFVRDRIAPAEVNLQAIEDYLKRQTPEEAQRLLNLNASYIFFKPSTESAVTQLGVSATDGRTIATDARLFPKGALAFLSSPKPEAPGDGEAITRFVLDQDVGGAITGPGRLDLFWGRGDPAKLSAGRIKQRGRLVYLAPKTPAPE